MDAESEVKLLASDFVIFLLMVVLKKERVLQGALY
jgi:hypothetical protein